MPRTSGYPTTAVRNRSRFREMESGGWAWREKASDSSWRMWVLRDLHVARENLVEWEERETTREKRGIHREERSWWGHLFLCNLFYEG